MRYRTDGAARMFSPLVLCFRYLLCARPAMINVRLALSVTLCPLGGKCGLQSSLDVIAELTV